MAVNSLFWSTAVTTMPKGEKYSFTQCFYLLSIFMVELSDIKVNHGWDYCFIEYVDWSLLIQGKPFKTVIYFFPKKIMYVFHGIKHVVSDLNLVYYMYFLMGQTEEKWMHEVLKVVSQSPRPLAHLSKLCVKGNSPGESYLRRFCIPNNTFIKEMSQKGRVMSVEEYSDYFRQVCGENRCLFETVWTSGRERETIYMLDLPFFGKFSDMLHLTSLRYLLSFESVLCLDHTWEEIHPGTFLCQLEKFHMIFWRGGWQKKKEFFTIFLDVQLGDLCQKDLQRIQVSQKINSPVEIEGVIGPAEYSFLEWFLCKYLWKRIPLKVHSLKELSRYQLALNLFMKRLLTFSQYPLTPMEIDDPSLVENTQEFVEEISMWFRDYISHLEDAEGASPVTGYMLTDADTDFIWERANDKGMEVMLNVLLNYENFNQFGRLIGWEKFIQLQEMFEPPDLHLL